jgi:ribonuclease Z
MIKITVLGTSSATGTKDRNFPGVALEYDGGLYLFDCGEGTQRQLAIYGINMSKIKAIFLTHIHGDHVMGVPGLVRTLAMNKRTEPLDIFIPAGYEMNLKRLIMFDKTNIPYRLGIHGVKGGTVMGTKSFEVVAFKVDHTVKCYGYSFIQKDRLRFMKDKCTRLGIKGEMFAELEKNGRIRINGKVIKLKDVTFKQKGKKIVYIADTRPAKSAAANARGADILFHEATYGSDLAARAKEYKHATAKEAAEVARRASVKLLVLHHISARYRSADALEAEAKEVFRNTVFAKDGMSIKLDK